MNRKLWLIWKEPKNRQRFTIGLQDKRMRNCAFFMLIYM